MDVTLTGILIGSGIAAIPATVGAWAAIRTANTNSVAESNKQNLEELRLQIAGWKDFANAYLAEIKRLREEHKAEIEDLERENTAYRAEIQRLRGEKRA